MILTGTDLTCRALDIAMEAHRGQFRADQVTPYVDHPIDVAARFYQVYMDGAYRMMRAEDEFNGQAVSYLHDVVEDCHGWTFERLAAEGFEAVIPSLRLLTNDEGLSYLDYLLRLKRSGDYLALTVKLCDMSSNEADLERIPSAGRRKAMATKYSLARYVLTHP